MRAKRCLDDRNRVFLSLFVCLLVLCVSGCNKSESERYLQLLQEQGITDNTQNHLQNCDREFVQVSPNGVFMSRVKSQHDMALYQLEDGKYKKIAEQAYGFFESEGKVYYYDGENNIYCYEAEARKTKKLFSVSMTTVSWIGLYNHHILCAGRSEIYNRALKLYTLDGNCEKTYFDKSGELGQIAQIGRFVVFLQDLKAEVYDLERDKSHYLIWEKGLSDSFMVIDEENLYISAGRYVIEGDYSTSRRDSKRNGTWKIRLSDMEKDKWDLEKISDQSYSKFYCIKNQLFDEKFELIENG